MVDFIGCYKGSFQHKSFLCNLHRDTFILISYLIVKHYLASLLQNTTSYPSLSISSQYDNIYFHFQEQNLPNLLCRAYEHVYHVFHLWHDPLCSLQYLTKHYIFVQNFGMHCFYFTSNNVYQPNIHWLISYFLTDMCHLYWAGENWSPCPNEANARKATNYVQDSG